MDLGREEGCQNLMDHAVLLEKVFPFEALGDQEHFIVATPGGVSGMARVPAAIVQDLQVEGRKRIFQYLFYF